MSQRDTKGNENLPCMQMRTFMSAYASGDKADLKVGSYKGRGIFG